jgi:GNAT superfamily N-acetyltransferase
MQYEVKDEIPLPQEYCDLRLACGLSAKTLEAAAVALPRSLYSVTVREGDRLIGMGRVIGDLGCHVQIADIAVHPRYQKKGISHSIMKRIMGFVQNNVPECAFVNLFADVDFLYHKYGFVKGTASIGMYLKRS